jgi:hypothetical protein
LGLGLGLDEKDLKMLRDDNRRILELEKNIKLLQSSTAIESLLEQLQNLKDALNSKVTKHDMMEMNEKMSKNL